MRNLVSIIIPVYNAQEYVNDTIQSVLSSDYENIEAYHTDTTGQIIDLGMKFGLVERKGAWYSYEDVRVSGMNSFTEELEKTGKLRELEQEVYDEMSNNSDDDD